MRTILTSVVAISLVSAASLRAGQIAYMTAKDGSFGTVNLNTGVFSTLGNSGQSLAGLGVFNGTLYSGSLQQTSSLLYTVNPLDGSLTPVGGAQPVTYEGLGSTTAGLYALDNNLSDPNLFSINPLTGLATEVGAIGISLLGNPNTFGMSDNSGTLFLSVGANLYTVDTTTAVASLVGSTASGVGIGALVFENGTLYGGANQPSSQVYILNPASGAATAGPAITGTTSPVYGLAPDPLVQSSTPEPATWVLLVPCAAIFIVSRLAANTAKARRKTEC